MAAYLIKKRMRSLIFRSLITILIISNIMKHWERYWNKHHRWIKFFLNNYDYFRWSQTMSISCWWMKLRYRGNQFQWVRYLCNFLDTFPIFSLYYTVATVYCSKKINRALLIPCFVWFVTVWSKQETSKGIYICQWEIWRSRKVTGACPWFWGSESWSMG